jgi:predicted dehydrogenase
MPVTCGVVGMRFGDGWARSIEAHPDLRLAAVCDTDPEVLAGKSALFGVRGFVRLDDLLASDVEAVALFTPAPLHAEQAIRTLEAGKHVLCAVPAAMSLPDCQRLIDAKERSGRQYMLAETSNWYPEVLHVKRLHEAGEMGRIFYYESEYLHESHTYWFTPDGAPTWRFGWPILKYLTHNSGPVVMITGERMTEVTAYGWGERSPEWLAAYGSRFTLGAALFRLSGGAVAKITIANVVERPEIVSFRFYGTKRSFESQRTRDEAHLVMTHTSAEPIRPEPPLESLPPSVQRLLKERPGHRGAEHFIVDAFARALAQGTRPPIDVYEAVAYTAPGICAQQSLQEGRTVRIPDFGRARGETWRR